MKNRSGCFLVFFINELEGAAIILLQLIKKKKKKELQQFCCVYHSRVQHSELEVVKKSLFCNLVLYLKTKLPEKHTLRSLRSLSLGQKSSRRNRSCNKIVAAPIYTQEKSEKIVKKVCKSEFWYDFTDDFTIDSRALKFWGIAHPREFLIFRAPLNCYVGTLPKKCLLEKPLL